MKGLSDKTIMFCSMNNDILHNLLSRSQSLWTKLEWLWPIYLHNPHLFGSLGAGQPISLCIRLERGRPFSLIYAGSGIRVGQSNCVWPISLISYRLELITICHFHGFQPKNRVYILWMVYAYWSTDSNCMHTWIFSAWNSPKSHFLSTKLTLQVRQNCRAWTLYGVTS